MDPWDKDKRSGTLKNGDPLRSYMSLGSNNYKRYCKRPYVGILGMKSVREENTNLLASYVDNIKI